MYCLVFHLRTNGIKPMMSQIDVVLVPETSLCAQQNADIFEHPSGPVWMNTVPVSGVFFFFFSHQACHTLYSLRLTEPFNYFTAFLTPPKCLGGTSCASFQSNRPLQAKLHESKFKGVRPIARLCFTFSRSGIWIKKHHDGSTAKPTHRIWMQMCDAMWINSPHNEFCLTRAVFSSAISSPPSLIEFVLSTHITEQSFAKWDRILTC